MSPPIHGANLDGNGIPQDQIKFTTIEAEFGRQEGNNNRSIGRYCIGDDIGSLTDVRLDTDAGPNSNTPIPGPGQEVKFSNFYNAKLNVIVDVFSGTGNEKRVDAKSFYSNKFVKVLGPTKDSDRPAPSEMGGRRVIIHVNKPVECTTSHKEKMCALRTGTWDTNTILELDVGSSGFISGAGGKGGNGAKDQDDGGEGGEDANSAIGIQHNGTVVRVLSGGYVQCGYGGGGGGGAGTHSDKDGIERCSGSGGGGGAGLPPGKGGEGGDRDGSREGKDGNDGTSRFRGEGGGEVANGQARGGHGGKGGDSEDNAENGEDGEGGGGEAQSPWESEGGDGGGNGAAIRRDSGKNWSYAPGHPLGTVHGSTSATGVL